MKYVFHNDSDQNVDATVAFPLPDIDGATLYHVPNDLPAPGHINFMDFQVTSENKPVAIKTEVRAFNEKGTDISEQLKKEGLPLAIGDPMFQKVVEKLSNSKIETLTKDEIIAFEDDQNGKITRPLKDFWANWTSRIQFYWTQHFPAHREIKVEHSYRPVVGGNYITRDDDGSSHIKPFCGDANVLKRIKEFKQKHPVSSSGDLQLMERRIRYILKTANNWNGPFGRFHLSIQTGDPDDIFTTCMPGIKQSSTQQYELTRTDFHLDKDLNILILQKQK